jgi:hypothetical protein
VVAATIVNGASIAAAFFNHHVGAGQYAVAKDFLAQGREIGPVAALPRRSFWDNPGDYVVSLPKFHSFAGTQPSL